MGGIHEFIIISNGIRDRKVDQWLPEAEVGNRDGQQADLREFGGVIEMF